MSLFRNCSTLSSPFLFRSVQRRPCHSSSSCCIWYAKDGIDTPNVLAVETDRRTTTYHCWKCYKDGNRATFWENDYINTLTNQSWRRKVPLLDGSALCWVKSIEEVGICIAKDGEGNTMKKEVLKITRPIFVYDDDSFVAAFPSSSQKVTCGIDFPNHEAIGKQWYSWCADKSSYKVDIAPARTFGLYEQIQQLKEAGLIKGGSLDNALVCSVDRGWLNPPLHFADEPCRHKLLDLLGDLSLCSINAISGIPFAHVIAYKASHSLHVRFSKELHEAYIREQ